MKIDLCDVTAENFRACIDLKVGAGQERFVATNLMSIAESKIYPYLTPQAIYAGDELIGFALYGRDPETEKLWIVRLMIDEKFQGRGRGRAAMRALIEKLGALPGGEEIFLSFVPGNRNAERLYASLGFAPTGETDPDGEIIMRLKL